MDPTVPTHSAIFTADELARLTAYRAAVAAGFSTDACTNQPAPGTALAATAEAVDASMRPACLFTPSEWARFSSYRAAVQAGFYTDGISRRAGERRRRLMRPTAR